MGSTKRLKLTACLSFLNQTAKIQWLELGDENSKLFHMSIKNRRTDLVHSIPNAAGEWIHNATGEWIHNAAGEWVQSTDCVQEDFTQFYASIFCDILEGRSHVNTVIMNQGPRLIDAHIALLTCNFQEEDIKGVMNAIPVNKLQGSMALTTRTLRLLGLSSKVMYFLLFMTSS